MANSKKDKIIETNTIIEVKNLNYSYDNNKILDNINFTIDKKDLVAIIGHNGSGKSTLMKLLLGILKAEKKNSINIMGKLAYIPQKYNYDNNFPAKVNEILELECCNCSLRKEVLKSLGIESIGEKQFKSLSGGQQQRVLIALSLLAEPEILILDEPTVGIDMKTQEEFYKILKKLNLERNLTILFVTHDTGMISEYFTKIICLNNKKIHIDEAKNIHSILHTSYGESFHEIHHHHHNEKEVK